MSKEFTRLIETIAMLRDPKKGCPWDLAQNHKSLLPYLIEEAYEYIQAVKEEDSAEMEEELGDVLLQVVLHAQIASEDQTFNIDTICKKLTEKMLRRHPHVFQNQENNIAIDELHINWEKIKQQEKASKNQTSEFFFSEKDLTSPPLLSANQIGKRSQKVDFDWENTDQVWLKVQEELEELKQEIDLGSKVRQKEELGDLLFSIAQLARHLEIDPHDALIDANRKFVERFKKIEENIKPKKITDISRKEKEQAWNKVKENEKTN